MSTLFPCSSMQRCQRSSNHMKPAAYKYLSVLCRNFRIRCCNASMFSNVIQPTDYFRGPNECKSLAARSGMYSRCVSTRTPNLFRQFSEWFDEPHEGAHYPDETLDFVEAQQVAFFLVLCIIWAPASCTLCFSGDPPIVFL